MRFLKILFFYVLPGLAALLVLTTVLIMWQLNMLSAEGWREVRNVFAENPPAEVYRLVMGELSKDDFRTDPSYGRRPVAGRGHTPWVIRANLDERPRMLNFALAEDIWAAYDTQSGHLYQVWHGSLDLRGAVYNYQHGPQPSSRGEWLYRQPEALRRDLAGDTPQEFRVRYLGHSFSDGGARAALSYELQVVGTDAVIRVTEEPELVEGDDGLFLERRIRVENPAGIVAGVYDGEKKLFALDDGKQLFRLALAEGRPLQVADSAHVNSTSEGDIALGEQVILKGDCVGCHNVTDQVVGPAYARIARKFRGRMQDNVIDALATSILKGSVGTWGEVPMPGHPGMSRKDARLAAIYILSTNLEEAEYDLPLNAEGEPYAAESEYQIGPRLEEVHPSFTLENLLPPGFQPKVGGMAFRRDGKLLLSSWDSDGGVFLLDLARPPASRVLRIADGLQEPLGLTVVDDRLFVLQKQELTELIDHDGDEIIDEYRAISNQWPTTSNFHSFAFGLVYKEGYFYALLSICVQPGGASCPEQLPSLGKLMKISLANGSVDYIASGFRTPNGIALSPAGEIWVNDNQGDWLPASKLMHVEEGKFYGSRAVPFEGVMEAVETPPVAWLPQDQIGNSPTEPAWLTEGPYAGQVIFGDVYQGGVQRVYAEQVNGAWQGAVMRFSAGFPAGVNRFARGPDGHLYVGQIGNPPNWGELGKPWYGLDRMVYRGETTFELLRVRTTPDGFALDLTAPLAADLELRPQDLQAIQWFYYPTEQYGGPMYDRTELVVDSLALSADRRTLEAKIPGLKEGYVVYLALDRRLEDGAGNELWVNEAWYSLNAIPDEPVPLSNSTRVPDNALGEAEEKAGWELMFDGEGFGHWRNYGSDGEVQKWVIESGTLKLEPDSVSTWLHWIFGTAAGDLLYGKQKYRDFELSLEWKISENGNSGIFYFVADEEHRHPWETGLEMQVLHNEGHPDGQIEKHRAGDLYDLISAEPITVKPPGQWNQVLIRVKDRRVEHWLNGVKVVEFTHGDAAWDEMVAGSKFVDMPDFGKSDTGYIVLQDHGDPVWYRNLKVRSLGDGE